MANETFANKKKKKSIETIQETKHTGKKKKKLRLTQTFSLRFLDSGTEKEIKKKCSNI